MGFFRFLKSLRTLARNGDITIDEAYKFARQEFGEEQVQIWRRSYSDGPPNGESLEDTYNRVIPYFENEIMPALQKNKNVIISAHGNSLRALVKFIEEISKEEIVKLEIATGEPIFYEFNESKLQRKLNW